MRRASRKRGECDGPWKCAAAARQRQTRVRNAATGWTTKMEDSDFRVLEGRLKSPPVLSILSARIVSHDVAGKKRYRAMNSLPVYPTWILVH
jgi:hypothetical protein